MQLSITYQMSSKINQILLLSKSSSINSSVLNLFLEPIFVGLSLMVIMFQCIFICILSFDIFNNKFLRCVGKFSFGIYLLHPDCIVYAKNLCTKLNCKATFELIIFAFFFSFSLGFFFFYLVENFLIKLSKFFCNKIEKLKYFNE